MARAYRIGGRRFHRRSLVALSSAERADLSHAGQVVVRRAVEWPLRDSVPDFARAWVDAGGTDVWGPGPYLKVPNRVDGRDDELVNRVFCPWGYPPDRVRISWSARYLQLDAVMLSRVAPSSWEWVLTLVPWVPDAARPASSRVAERTPRTVKNAAP